METSIRAFRRDDIEFALAQTSREGWEPTAAFFELCLAHDPEGCFIAEADGRRVGVLTTTRYCRTAWIGNLVVGPEHRRRGIGGRLMTHGLAHLSDRGAQTIRLEADPPGIKLYRRLGFVDEFESLRFQLAHRRRATPATVERMTATDLPAVAGFDAEHFGDYREVLLKLLFEQARGAYWVRERGRIQGYAFAVPSHLGMRIGPWVATDQATAEMLLRAILADLPDTTVLVGATGPNTGAIALLESYGFGRTPSSFRMVRGDGVGAGRPDSVFGIANGGLG